MAQALEDCRQAVALAPEDHHAHLCLGHMHFVSGDYCAAEESYNAALELNPGDACEASGMHVKPCTIGSGGVCCCLHCGALGYVGCTTVVLCLSIPTRFFFDSQRR